MAAADPYSLDEEERKKNQQTAPTGQAVLPPQQVQPTAQPPGRNPSPTNFTNFARRFSANKQASQQQANKYAGQAQGAVGKAAGSLAGAQTTFAAGVNSGSVAPPPGTNAPAATNTGAAIPPAAPPPAASANPVPAGGQQLDPLLTTPGGPTTASGPTMADMLAQAGKQYTGPAGLDTTQATPDALAAQEQLDALKDPNGIQELVNESGNSGTRGADALSGALIGTAGRKDFDALRARFNPNKDLLDAQAAATKQAADAKDASGKNATAWGQQATAAQAEQDRIAAQGAANQSAETGAKTAANQKALDTVPEPGQESDVMHGLDPTSPEGKQRAQELDAFNKAVGDGGAHDVLESLSPSQGISRALGVRDPLGDYFNKQAPMGGSGASGSTHGDQIPWGSATRNPTEAFWVFRQMTPEQWQEVNSLPHDGQKEWIQKRLLQIRAKQNGQPIPGGNNWPKSGGA